MTERARTSEVGETLPQQCSGHRLTQPTDVEPPQHEEFSCHGESVGLRQRSRLCTSSVVKDCACPCRWEPSARSRPPETALPGHGDDGPSPETAL